MVQAGESPLQLPPKREDGPRSKNPLLFLLRFTLGTTAGFYYFILPWYMWLKNLIWPKNLGGF